MDFKARTKKLLVIVILFSVLFTFVLCSRIYASTYGDNLVSDGSFSSGDESTAWVPAAVGGFFDVIDPVAYGIEPCSGDGSYVLDYYNPGTADAESYQEIDVSSFASDIAKHKVNLNVSGYTRKYWHSASAVIRLDLYGNSGNLLDTYYIQGPDVGSDPLRNQDKEWAEISKTFYNINPNTSLVKISLVAHIEQGVADPYASGFNTADSDYVEFDGINLNLTLDTSPPGGYSASIGPASITDANKANFSYTLSGAEAGSTYNYTITSSGGAGSVTGTGIIASATDTKSGIDVGGLPDGTLTLSVTLTDVAGNTGSAATDTVLKDVLIPSGYSVNIVPEYVNNANKNDFSFTFSGAEPGAAYNYTVVSSGSGAAVTGSGTITTAADTVPGINVAGLGDGTLTLSATITDAAGNVGSAATDTVSKDATAPTAIITAGATAGGDALVNAAEKAEGFIVTAQSSEAAGKLYVVPDGTAADISDITAAKIGEADVTAANADTTVAIAANHTGVSDRVSYKIYAVDAAGNISAISGVAFTADLAAPTGGSISINSGNTYTTSSSVALTLYAAGADLMMLSEDSSFTGSSYEAYSTGKSFTLSSGDGIKTVYVKYMDAAGNETGGTISDSITLDVTAPTGGSISINNGDNYTNTPSVTLTLYAAGADRMMVSEDSSFTGSSYEVYSTGKSFTLSSGDGIKTVYIKYMDAAGNETGGIISDNITFDATAPTGGSISINSGNAYTNTSSVALTLSAAGADRMMLSEDSSFTGSSYEAYSTGKSFTLSSGDGIKTVYVKYMDTAGNETGDTISDSITLDTTAPTGGSISINGGNTYTNTSSVALTLSAAGADRMMLSEDSSFTGSSYEAYSTGKSFTLSSGDGTKTVYVKYMDTAGNETGDTISDSIILDATAPTDGSISINSGAAYTTGVSVTLTLSATGADRMMISEDSSFAGSSYEAYSTGKSFTLSSGYGTKTVYVKYMDAAGNETSGTISDSIFYKSVPVSGNSTINGTEDTIIHFSASDFVYSSQLVKIRLESLPAHGKLNLGGNAASLNQEILAEDLDELTYTPDINWNGTDSLDWKGSDGDDYSEGSAEISINIAAVNDPPAANAGSLTANAGKAGSGILPAYDADGDSLLYSIVSQGSKGTAEITDAAAGTYSYTPKDGIFGSDSFTYRVYDGSDYSNTATVSVVIIPSGTADLASLMVVPGTLEPGFEANTMDYEVSLGNSQSSISVTACVYDLTVSDVSINGVSVTGDVYGKYTRTISLNIGANIIPVTVTAQDGTTAKTYTITAKRKQQENSNNTPSNNGIPANNGAATESDPTLPSAQPQSTEVIVNGEVQNAGTTTTSTVGGKTVTTVSVDGSKIKAALDAKGNNSTVVISINGTADIAVGALNGQTIKDMEEKGATLVIKTDTASYTLPASEINIGSISAQTGTQAALKDITVSVTIAAPPADIVKVVADTANKNGYQLVVAPVEFKVTCTSGDKAVEISKFNGYVERTVAIPDGIDPSKITTGIVLNADGTFLHVPTQIIVIDGKYYARINSLTSSIYSVIYSPREFKDVDSHWAKEAINDMASRLVINGADEESFIPDRDITRAEFAAILVRALGLRPGTGASGFDDVKSGDWYSGYVKTAVEYKLISGYGEGKFGPMDKITREQAMTIIARAMKMTGLESGLAAGEADQLLASFKDGDSSAVYARSSIAECIKAGIVSGRSSTEVAPKGSITRAEVAVMVRRLLLNSKLI